MSQNKTVFPGVGDEGDFTPNRGRSYGTPQPPQNHTNGPKPRAERQGTIFPGMNPQGAPSPEPSGAAAPGSTPRNASAGKPVVGFLYSISRTGAGEYWPLHIGQNIIGSREDCDIVLGEGTVSKQHANLHINKMKKPEKTEAVISDMGSTNGTLVNGNSISMARPMECVNGDIITVGENYELVLLLVDTKALGLEVSSNFIDISGDKGEDYLYEGPAHQAQGPYGRPTVNQQDEPPRFYRPQDSVHPGVWPEEGGTDSTVGIDPSQGGFRRGGTVGTEV